MFFMNRPLVLMCVMFAALGSANSYAEQKLQAAKSDIVFVSKQMGVPVEGRFKSFDAQISFDPAKPAKFAKAGFQSTAIKNTAPGKYEVSGKLSIKGVSQDIVVPVSLTQTGGLTTAVGSFAIKRLGFKIGDNEWSDTSLVADEVQVKFKFVLTGVAKL